EDEVELHRIALRRHLPGKAEKVLHDLFGALRLLQDHAQIFPGSFWKLGIIEEQVGKAEDRGQRIIYLVSHAGNELSNRRHFLGVNEFVAQIGGVGDVGHDHDDAVDVALLVAHGAEVHRELPGMAVAAHNLQFQVVDLSPKQSGLERIRQRTDEAGSSQLQERTPEQFTLLETGIVPAAGRVADEAGGIGDQDEALRVAENLAREVALPLQLRLISVEAGDIEHQAANLQQMPETVVHAEGGDED